MSQAVSIRPDLYAAYLHGASQWDGTFEAVAENGVAVYIFMALFVWVGHYLSKGLRYIIQTRKTK